jgi:phosphate/phosphite/phosphonate ABC transporter binding protein
MTIPSRLVFGLAMPESLAAYEAGVGSLIRWFGTKAGVELVRFQVPSYEALARQMVEGAIQVAWLPPIVFVRLERVGIAVPLVVNHRGGSGGYQSVLLVRGASKIHTLDDLRGASAAWVDPLSASGYVLPRIQLAAHGIDPRTIFGEERFYGSHPAAVGALLDGSADVAATFAGLDPDGGVARGGWTNLHPASGAPGQTSSEDDVRILATFGVIPGDLIAVRNDVAPEIRATLASAFAAVCQDETMGPIARRLFGVESFSSTGFASYDGLRRAIDAAAERGLMDVAVVNSSRSPTRPPGPAG